MVWLAVTDSFVSPQEGWVAYWPHDNAGHQLIDVCTRDSTYYL